MTFDSSALALLLLGIVGGLALSALGFWLLLRRRASSAFRDGAISREAELAALTTELRLAHENAARADQEAQRHALAAAAWQAQVLDLTRERSTLAARLERIAGLESELGAAREEVGRMRTAFEHSELRRAELTVRIEEQTRQSEEKLLLLERVREQMTDSFKTLSQEILEEKARRFTEQNAQNLGTLLDPLREQLKDFHKTVTDAYGAERAERSVLKHEIEQLRSLNVRIGEDALNLTRALKGESRTQGAWGEMILERLLEASGLQAGREFETQVVLKGDDGGRPRPDVIVHLPDRKDLVIDAKVSLVAYERYSSALDAGERGRLLSEHLASMRRHVQDLAGRRYTEIEGLQSLDFVLMFVPVEAAFMEAVRHDDQLYAYALERNVAIVTTSTLLATLRTVASLWRFDDRNRNALEIAEKAGALHEKFVGFVADLERVQGSFDGAQRALSDAANKLVSGRGNLVRRAEELKKLGAKSSKALDAKLLERAETDGLAPPDPAANES